MHGARSPLALEAAEARKNRFVEPVWLKLVDIALNSPDPYLQWRACRDVLDRCGVTAGVSVTVRREQEPEESLAHLSTEELRDRAAALLHQIEDLDSRSVTDGGYVEATVISNEAVNTGEFPSAEVAQTPPPGGVDHD